MNQTTILFLLAFLFGLYPPLAHAGDFKWDPEYIASKEVKFNEEMGFTGQQYVHFCTGTWQEMEDCAFEHQAAVPKERYWKIQGQAEPEEGPSGALAMTDASAYGTHGTGLMNANCENDFPEIEDSEYAKEKLCVMILVHEYRHTSPFDAGGDLTGGADELLDPEPCDHMEDLFDYMDYLCEQAEAELTKTGITEEQRAAGLSVLCGLYEAAANAIYRPANWGVACEGLPPVGYPPILSPTATPVCSYCISGNGQEQQYRGTDYGRLELDN